MDAIDKKILDFIQTGFPIEHRPYAIIGEEVGIAEQEVFERVKALKRSGVIRRIGGNFQSHRLGWKSTLCSARVPEEKLDQFIAEVNALPGVTHNYLRDHPQNIWFTYIGSSWRDVSDTLAGITRRTGVEILNLPAEKMYKIKVDFSMNEGSDQE